MSRSLLWDLLEKIQDHPDDKCAFCDYCFTPGENLFVHLAEKHNAALWSLVFQDIEKLHNSE